MSEYASFLKVGSMACVLRMFENPDIDFRDLTLESPVRAIREISHDITCRKKVKLKSGREMSALDIQRIYLDKAISYSERFGFSEEETRALQMWEHCVSTIEDDPLKLEAEVDWVAKYRLMLNYSEKHHISLGDPRCHLIDLQYHDIDPEKGIFYHMRRKNIMRSLCTEEQIVTATQSAPTTTRAHLRSQFISAAQLKKRDYTVDWVHLKINDQTQRTVLCKNPFKNVDDRVQKLIDSL
jgi:proteasome accessory factor A